MKADRKQRQQQKPRVHSKHHQTSRRSGSSGKSVGSDTSGERSLRLLAFAGYMAAVWLILQSVNGSAEPVFGYRWSPAVLGLVVAMAVALIRNEWDLRTHLTVFDAEKAGRTAYSLAWGLLGVVAIAAVMTLPRY